MQKERRSRDVVLPGGAGADGEGLVSGLWKGGQGSPRRLENYKVMKKKGNATLVEQGLWP